MKRFQCMPAQTIAQATTTWRRLVAIEVKCRHASCTTLQMAMNSMNVVRLGSGRKSAC